MNKIVFFKRLLFVSLLILCGVILNAQSLSPQYPAMDPETYGTEENPYVINNETHWRAFADDVNDKDKAYSYDGKFVKLTHDIELTINNSGGSEMIVGKMRSANNGTEDKWFSGTFDGDWHTITFKVGTEKDPYTPEHNFSPNAPFRVIDGATIKNLSVTGTIISSKKYNSGLAGYSYSSKTKPTRENKIINCTSSIFIDCTYITAAKSDCSSAGFLAENRSGGMISFTNCIFTGTISRGDNPATTQKSAGFVSYNNGNSNSVRFTNCTMAGTITIESNIATFNRNGKDSYSEAYYITNYGGSPQGTQAPTKEPTDYIAKKYTVGTTNYYVPGSTITGLEETVFQYTGSAITITPVVEYYGRTIGTENYTISIEKKNGDIYEPAENIIDAGDYHYIISGTGNYGGSLTTDIKVIRLNSWASLIVAMNQSKGTFDLTEDLTATNPLTTDTAIWVKGNITLNMHGHTLNRNLEFEKEAVYGQVIRVMEGASLTINGQNGTITGGHSWPGTASIPAQGTYYAKRDAGGIHNRGNLVLNNVNIINNGCEKGTAGQYIYSARGGGIYSGPGSSLVIEDCEVSGNVAPGGGGGIYCEGANTIIMTNVYVEGNTCDSKGGGVRILTAKGATAYMTDCTIYFNIVDEDASQGAGVFLEGGNLVMTRCDIMGNQATQQGAGFYSLNGTTTAIDCNICYNGTFYDDPNNRGAGVCLNDNKGSYHSVFIMDGGTIEGNNCTHDGGGIYVHEGAIFQVKGDVIIRDNYKAGMYVGSSNNNAYLAGASVIEVIGPLGENAEINITPSGSGARAYIIVADGISSSETMSHFAIDDNGYTTIIDEDGNIEVYEPYAWNNTATWNGSIAENSSGTGTVPTEASDLEIHRSVKIPSGYVAYAKSISTDAYCNVIIEDGGQLLNDSENVNVLAKKNIVAADDSKGAGGWYIISSPVANPSITDNTNLITEYYYSPTYDLYRFNEAAELQWENYRAGHAGFTTLQNGRGYLYRNEDDYTIEISGINNNSDVSYTLSYAANNELKGFNLIGNPYSHTVYKGAAGSAIPNGELLEGKYYVLNSTTGDWVLTNDGTAIAPLQGILVQATKAGTLTMSNSTTGAASKDSKGQNIWFTVANSKYEDKACVEFKEGHGLNKIEHMNEESPMLYIRHNNEDFASVDMNPEAKMFNLNFEAKTFGRYTLSVNPQGGYRYLHLIDRLAEKDIDLLVENEYSFIGSPADYANRFIVRLEHSDSVDEEEFAYQSGNDIVVAGEGELQVFDVMGRMVMRQNVNGVQTVNGLNNGVYILRLEGKTQKIVIK